jgi:hypothetical protein
MSKELDRKIKTALNETRLLILGAQVLLGFEYQSFFQDGFPELSTASKSFCVAGLFLVILSTGLLVTPSMEHRLVEEGRSSLRLVKTTGLFTGLGLVPLTASLGLAAYVVIERHFGMAAGLTVGFLLAGLAVFGWFGVELLVGSLSKVKPMEASGTPLATKIEQLLTEARVIIPGAQALFGFQFIAMLTTGFDRLPQTAKVVHATALCLIAVNVVLLMTPAALHRLSFDGEDSRTFLRMGSALVITAPLFLAGGIGAETYVVMRKVFEGERWAVTSGVANFLVLITFWYAVPLALRMRLKRYPARTTKPEVSGPRARA